MKSFAFCKCFLSQNIFLPKLKLHVRYENDTQFRTEYRNFIPEKDIEPSLEAVKVEIKRRKQVRENVQERKDLVKTKYKQLFPQVYNLAPDDVLMEHQSVQKISQDIFALPVFKPEFAQNLLSEVKHFKSSQIPHEQPNSMNKHGVILDEIGFQDFFDQLRVDFIQPLARQLFHMPDLELDSHKAFMVKYRMDEDVDLAPHFDNAEVTLNVAMSANADFEGGELVFYSNNRVIQGYEHDFSHGVLHLGHQIHQALPISWGERWNLIVWARSSRIRQSLCPMCGSAPQLDPAPARSYGDGFLMN